MLREVRKASSVTQRELSMLLGRSYTNVQKIEPGERQVRVLEAAEILIALKVDVKEFFARFLNEVAYKP